MEGKDTMDAVFQRQFLEWAHELFSWILACARTIRLAHPLYQLMSPRRWHDTETYCCSLYWLRIQTAQWIGRSECTPLWNIQTMVLVSRTQQLHCPWALRVYFWWNVFCICTKLTINTMNIILQLYVHTSIAMAATPIWSVQQSWSPSKITQGVLSWGGNTTL